MNNSVHENMKQEQFRTEADMCLFLPITAKNVLIFNTITEVFSSKGEHILLYPTKTQKWV